MEKNKDNMNEIEKKEKKEELMNSFINLSKGKPMEEWDEETKNAYLELIKNDFYETGNLFYKIIETDADNILSNKFQKPLYNIVFTDYEIEQLLFMIQVFRYIYCPHCLRTAGFEISVKETHLFKDEFMKQLQELTKRKGDDKT